MCVYIKVLTKNIQTNGIPVKAQKKMRAKYSIYGKGDILELLAEDRLFI